MQPATEHGFLLPPCVMQCDSSIDFKPVVQPAVWHFPYAPCFWQRLRACASVLQPSLLHTFLLPPPCLEHPPVDTAPEVQNSIEQIPFAPCFMHRPFPLALLLQPSAEHSSFLEWWKQSPLFCAFRQHAYTLQIPMAPCFMQTNLPSTWLVLQPGQRTPASVRASCIASLVLLRWCSFPGAASFCRTHSPFALCLLHKPYARELVEQPSIVQGFFACPLALTS